MIEAIGLATFYAFSLSGNYMANGVRYDPLKYTAAHRTIPFGTCLRVKNLRDGKEVFVRVTDRGPFSKASIDLSSSAFSRLSPLSAGVIKVSYGKVSNKQCRTLS